MNILITGGTGTFGKCFVNFLIDNDLDFDRIAIFSRDEYKQHAMERNLRKKVGDDLFEKRIRMWIGDVRDVERLETAFQDIDYVIHAAALKHVPVCEYNPNEAIKTNIVGTKNVIAAAIKQGVLKVIGLSTDKAVEPVNLYGATKMAAEKLLVYGNSNKTKICSVRYGNIIGSRGSVIEVFENQNKKNWPEPFTVTSSEMTRFWMPAEESVKLVLHALSYGIGGEVFLPKKDKIKCGYVGEIANIINPSRDIKYTGVRPGEKLHEILLNQTEYDRLYLSEGKNNEEFYAILPEKRRPHWYEGLYEFYSPNKIILNEKYCSNSFNSKDNDEFVELIKRFVG